MPGDDRLTKLLESKPDESEASAARLLTVADVTALKTSLERSKDISRVLDMLFEWQTGQVERAMTVGAATTRMERDAGTPILQREQACFRIHRPLGRLNAFQVFGGKSHSAKKGQILGRVGFPRAENVTLAPITWNDREAEIVRWFEVGFGRGRVVTAIPVFSADGIWGVLASAGPAEDAYSPLVRRLLRVGAAGLSDWLEAHTSTSVVIGEPLRTGIPTTRFQKQVAMLLATEPGKRAQLTLVAYAVARPSQGAPSPRRNARWLAPHVLGMFRCTDEATLVGEDVILLMVKGCETSLVDRAVQRVRARLATIDPTTSLDGVELMAPTAEASNDADGARALIERISGAARAACSAG